MVTSAQIKTYLGDQPFRPFRLHMASGQHFDVRHPEMIRLGRGILLAFFCKGRAGTV